MARNQSVVLLLLGTLMGAIVEICLGASLTVGDKTGWTVPTGSSFYSDWAKKQTFQIGDQLVFNFPPGAHTVAEVSKAAYDGCTTTANPISAVKTAAPANYTLSSASTHYYICTITGHCDAGQKLAVTATGPAKKTPSASPASSPSATSPSGAATGPAAGVTPAASGPSAASGPAAGGSALSPAGNFAGPTAAGVSLLSLISLAVATLLF